MLEVHGHLAVEGHVQCRHELTLEPVCQTWRGPLGDLSGQKLWRCRHGPLRSFADVWGEETISATEPGTGGIIAVVPPIYVTGHRNPDTDSIASAIGYAELKGRLDPHNEYVPVRLGDCNAQTRWVLERSRAPEPEFLPHVSLRARDVMQTSFPVSGQEQTIREAGIAMMRADLELVPIVDDDGALVGVLTERALARRFVRESRHTSTLEDAPTTVSAVAEALDGRMLTDGNATLAGRVWVQSMDVQSPTGISEGDVVVVGNRVDAQRLAIERGAALLVLSNDSAPPDEVLALARERGTAVIVSPLDSYVSGRMITLAAPCSALMEPDPLTVTTDYLVADVSEQIKEIHYGAAVAIDAHRRPVGLVTRRTWSRRRAGGCCSSTTPSSRRASPASSRPRSSRSSTTTTSARSRRGCPSRRRSIRSGRRRRSWSSGSARTEWSRAGRPR